MKTRISILFALFLPALAFAWGSTGHRAVATIAKKNIDTTAIRIVQQFLGTMSFEEAATWMDDVRDDHSYDYMKPWHYVNIDSGGTYKRNPKGDVVSMLDSVISELRNYKKLKREKVQTDLKILFHLCGDIAQPLHAGYGKDLGGNTVTVSFDDVSTNLHSVWDSKIIDKKNILVSDCLKRISKWNEAKKTEVKKISPLAWMYDSRSLLPKVYALKGSTKIKRTYISAAVPLIEEQLAKAGYRLASVLNSIFGKG
jgi:hypothetical protein